MLLARRVVLEFDISKVQSSHESKDAWNIEYSASIAPDSWPFQDLEG